MARTDPGKDTPTPTPTTTSATASAATPASAPTTSGVAQARRWRATSSHEGLVLCAFEPDEDQLHRSSAVLSGYYNDVHNRTMMANTVTMTAADVAEHLTSLRARGGRPFLLDCDGALVGDADFRHVTATSAEFAILIGDRARQARGLGFQLACLLHALAFVEWGLQRTYVSIIPENLASQRLFAKVGYRPDAGPAARAFADEPTDLTFSIERDHFLDLHRRALPGMTWEQIGRLASAL